MSQDKQPMAFPSHALTCAPTSRFVKYLRACLTHSVMWVQDYKRLHAASWAALPVIIVCGTLACPRVNDEILSFEV